MSGAHFLSEGFSSSSKVNLSEVQRRKGGGATSRLIPSVWRCQMSHSSPTLPENALAIQSQSTSWERLMGLGYIAGKRVNLYGEIFEIASDPFIDGDWVAVRVTGENDPTIRTIRLPVSILVGLTDLSPKHAR
jgi:hypothetical protein